tara:strand:- start:586 stop:1209 length:624 start_codon:yes stop_codon:yes gene_type:complete
LKKNKISKNWLINQKKDKYFRQSKSLGYRSRSAFKLLEMEKKFKFMNESMLLLDLGSSPGGWSQIAAKKIKYGKILSVDLKPMEKINNTSFLMIDINKPDAYERIFSHFGKKIDVVISDMAANTTGNKDLDSYRTGELCLKAMEIAEKILNEKGVFLSKLFMGSIFPEIQKKANNSFRKVVQYKPLSSRKISREIYIYCKGISNSFN